MQLVRNNSTVGVAVAVAVAAVAIAGGVAAEVRNSRTIFSLQQPFPAVVQPEAQAMIVSLDSFVTAMSWGLVSC